VVKRLPTAAVVFDLAAKRPARARLFLSRFHDLVRADAALACAGDAWGRAHAGYAMVSVMSELLWVAAHFDDD